MLSCPYWFSYDNKDKDKVDGSSVDNNISPSSLPKVEFWKECAKGRKNKATQSNNWILLVSTQYESCGFDDLFGHLWVMFSWTRMVWIEGRSKHNTDETQPVHNPTCNESWIYKIISTGGVSTYLPHQTYLHLCLLELINGPRYRSLSSC